jgi:beta-mannosidase
MGVLDGGWRMAATPAGAWDAPPGDAEVEWSPAVVPGTVAASLAALGRPPAAGDPSLDEEDWWFATSFELEEGAEGEESVLRFEGVATVWQAFLDAVEVAGSESMFAARELDLAGRAPGRVELALCCRAMAPLLAQRRRPRARWRTRLAESNLRFFRTTLHGRAPGFSPGPPVIGPWRPVVLERRAVRDLRVRTRLEGDTGVVEVGATVLGDGPVRVELDGPSGPFVTELDGNGGARLEVPDAVRWWPHTHGEPALYELRLVRGERAVASRRVGFRELSFAPDLEADGLDLHVNGVPVFARGAVWTPPDPVGMAPTSQELRATLERVVAAGMNLVRLPGTGVYETQAFHDGCDELGLLVWQELMFANFDYPFADEGFAALAEAEARQELERVGGHPSLAVVCGNSEVEQQAAMMGLDPATGRGSFFGDRLPALVADAGLDAAYVPSAPCGGALPFRPSAGVASYFGVGGYRRPLGDARASEVRFASECLAIANVGDGSGADREAAPRDPGAEWDFADVRDHYLRELYGHDPVALAAEDPERYTALSRMVSGDVMARVMGEWRRAGSPCTGAVVLFLRDVVEGEGWGLLDRSGAPKVAWHHLRRALAPVCLWLTDEGLGGFAVHVANDGPDPLRARVRVALYRDLEQLVEEGQQELTVEPHGAWTGDAEGVVGGFRDLTWAYRFGPPAQDAVVVSLEAPDGELLSQSVAFPVGVPGGVESAEELGLEVRLDAGSALVLQSRRLAWGVRPHVPGWVPSDDAFTLEPGRPRTVPLHPMAPGTPAPDKAHVTALNLRSSVPVALGEVTA